MSEKVGELQRVALVVTYEDSVRNENLTRMFMGIVAMLDRVKGIELVQVLCSGRSKSRRIDLDALLPVVELRGDEVYTTYSHTKGAIGGAYVSPRAAMPDSSTGTPD